MIYAGAGATIDRTGLTWPALVKELFPDEAVTPSLLARMLEALGPDRVASVVTELYDSIHGEDARAQRLRHDLRRLLYRNGEWLVGRLSANLARLLTTQAIAKGGATAFTTNFDDHLDGKLHEQIGTLAPDPKVELKRYARSAASEDLSKQENQVNLVYLHGFVPDRELQEYQFVGDPPLTDHDPVLSENEYLEAGASYEELLRDGLDGHPVLIIGSSLTDPPLLRALLQTRSGGQARYALLPMQDSSFRASSLSDRSDLMLYVGKRLSHFGVTPIFPDFYSQVGQFLQEVDLATGLSPGEYAHPDFPDRYSDRLSRWWEGWLTYHGAERTHRDVQKRHHDRLADVLEEIRAVLDSDDKEVMKLEVWLRWKPIGESRYLRLWASSVGSVADERLMRGAEIDTDSEYASIRTFCFGRPAVLEYETGRWRVYFACPIWLPIGIGRGSATSEVPVGVITLASMTARPRGSLSLRNQAKLEQANTLMRALGREIAATNDAGDAD